MRWREEESKLIEKVVEARLRLLELQDAMKWEEEKPQLEREKIREKRKEIRDKIKKLDAFAEKIANAKEPTLKETKARKKLLEKQIKELEDKESQVFVSLQNTRKNGMRQVFQAEEHLRLLEARQARQREEFAARRERMQARLQRLEDKTLDLQPADRLRDVERKLDALRREVGESRRMLEREKQRP